MEDSLIYHDPIISKLRKGTYDDPYSDIKESLQVAKGRVVLTEIPSRENRVIVTDSSGNKWYEVTNEELKGNLFSVDYINGAVYFNSNHNGKTLTFTYSGRGVQYFPSDRVYHNKISDRDIFTVKEKLDRIDLDILGQKNRVDNLIRSTPQPSEIVDTRTDLNGKVYTVAKDRIDAEQKKIEDAYRDQNGKIHESLKSRIDAEQAKIETAYVDLNNKKFHTLKERIDAEQAKIEDTYVDKRGNTYISLKDRLDHSDDTVGNLKEFNVPGNSLIEKLTNEFISRAVNVKHYGAKGDGKTDDTSAVKAAVSVVESKGGGVVFFPKGDYLINGLIELTSNIHILGDLGTIIRKTLTSNEVYVFVTGKTKGTKGYGGGAKNISFSNIDFMGYLQGDSRKSLSITLNHAENVRFENCRFINCITNGHAIDLAGCNDVDIYNCQFIGSHFVDGREYTEAIQIDSSAPAALENGFSNYDSLPTKNVRVENCKFLPYYDSSGRIVQYAPNPIGNHGFTGGMYYEGVIFRNNLMVDGWRQDSNNWRAWIHFYGLRDSEFTGNRFLNTTGISAAVFGFYTTSNGRYDPVTGIAGTGEPLPNRNIKISHNYFEGFNNENDAEPIIRVYGTTYNSTVYRSVNFTVNDNQFTRNFGDWTKVTGGRALIHFNMFSDVHITNNRADLCKNIARAYEGWSLNISNNTASRIGQTGFTVQNVAGIIINSNTLSSTRRPFEILECSDLVIKNNVCTNIAATPDEIYSVKLRNISKAIIQSNIITTPSSTNIENGVYLYTFEDRGSSWDVYMFDNIINGFKTNKVYTTGEIPNYKNRES